MFNFRVNCRHPKAIAGRVKTHARPSPRRIWSFFVKGCRHRYRRTQKIGSTGTPLSWDGRRGWPQDTRSSPTCYHVKFGGSASKGVWINRRKQPKIGERLGPTPFWKHSMTLEICCSSTCVILPSVVILGQTSRALLRRSAWKTILPSCPVFQVSRYTQCRLIDPPSAT